MYIILIFNYLVIFLYIYFNNIYLLIILLYINNMNLKLLIMNKDRLSYPFR
jgi:hypothetical protein